MYSDLGLLGTCAVVQCLYHFKVLNTPIIHIACQFCVTFHLTLLMVQHQFVKHKYIEEMKPVVCCGCTLHYICYRFSHC